MWATRSWYVEVEKRFPIVFLPPRFVGLLVVFPLLLSHYLFSPFLHCVPFPRTVDPEKGSLFVRQTSETWSNLRMSYVEDAVRGLGGVDVIFLFPVCGELAYSKIEKNPVDASLLRSSSRPDMSIFPDKHQHIFSQPEE